MVHSVPASVAPHQTGRGSPTAPEPSRSLHVAGAVLRFALRLALVLALCASVRWLYLSLETSAQAGPPAQVDSAYSRVDVGPGWFDPRWRQEIGAALANLGAIDPQDSAAVEGAAQRLTQLSFVQSVAMPEVLWPDRLRLEFTWAEPVACIHAGQEYLSVTAAGRVLSGRWRLPPGRGSGFLPVVLTGPPPKGERTPREERSVRGLDVGTTVLEPSAVDGLSVAQSMWQYLGAGEVSRLGRIVIDARRARQVSLEEPGTILWLENARRIEFGRSPNLDAPGELPAAQKWALVARALELLDPSSTASSAPVDWSVLDVRWDQGALELRPGAPFQESPLGSRTPPQTPAPADWSSDALERE